VTRREYVTEAKARGYDVVVRRGLVVARGGGRTIVAGPAVGVAYDPALLDPPRRSGKLLSW